MDYEIMKPEYYSQESFRDKLMRYAKSIGKSLIEKVLILFYTATDSDTPASAKAVIYGALGYFILPLDAVPDIIPFVGFSDDLAAIVTALTMIAAHIKPQHKEKARETAAAIFSQTNI